MPQRTVSLWDRQKQRPKEPRKPKKEIPRKKNQEEGVHQVSNEKTED